MKRYFGCHVSASGGLQVALENGDALGINTIQIHASPPQRWNTKPFATGYEDAYLERKKTSQVEKVFFHAIYLINLANPDPQQHHLSKSSLLHALDLMGRIGGDGVIFHVGSLKDEPEEEKGLQRAADGINWILEKCPGDARLILEVAAGSGSVIGDRLEELRTIYDGVEDKSRVGFGLDSQHVWASGYDLKEDLEGFVTQVEQIFGLDKVWAVHLNDSKTELASRKDRHENFGDGLIGYDALAKFFTHKKLQHIPFILETPSMKSLDTAAEEVKKLFALAA